jgi:uncharacterized membrane protein
VEREDEGTVTSRSRISRTVRKLFLGGLVVTVPIVLTVKALVWLFRFVDGLAQPVAVLPVGREVSGIGFVMTVGTVLVAGFLFSFGPLERLLDSIEQVLDAVPVVGLVYGTSKKVLSGRGKVAPITTGLQCLTRDGAQV